MTCNVTHAPGQSYVCWTHRKFLPWSEPGNTTPGRCWCERQGTRRYPDA